jgi:hypothetical protein
MPSDSAVNDEITIYIGGEGDLYRRIMARVEDSRHDPAVVRYGVVLTPEIVARAILVEGLEALEGGASRDSTYRVAPQPRVAARRPTTDEGLLATAEALVAEIIGPRDSQGVRALDPDTDLDDTHTDTSGEAPPMFADEDDEAPQSAQSPAPAVDTALAGWLTDEPAPAVPLRDPAAVVGPPIMHVGNTAVYHDPAPRTADGERVHAFYLRRGWKRLKFANATQVLIVYAPIGVSDAMIDRHGTPHEDIQMHDCATAAPLFTRMYVVPPKLQ